jgi:hypothetical protein
LGDFGYLPVSDDVLYIVDVQPVIAHGLSSVACQNEISVRPYFLYACLDASPVLRIEHRNNISHIFLITANGESNRGDRNSD